MHPGTASPVATPYGKPRDATRVLTWPRLPAMAARIGIALARVWGRPLRLGRTVVVVRHADVSLALSRDLAIHIGPVNGPGFERIGFRFILGMDRSPTLIAERRVLYEALAAVDMAPIQAATRRDIRHRLAARDAGPFDIVADLARPVAAATASRLFGITPDDRDVYMDAARAVFAACFLNPANDVSIAERGKLGANLLTVWFKAEMDRRRDARSFGDDMMGRLLKAGVDDDLIRRTLGGMLVGAIDTTATVVAKVMHVLVADPALCALAQADAQNPQRLWIWCNEALRRWAHGPALSRRVAADCELAGTSLRAGDRVVLWTQAAMFDPQAFPDPAALRGDRSGAAYLHLGGGLHPCAGRSVNAWQIPMIVGALLDLHPGSPGPIRWAGPFPAHVPIQLAGTPP